MPPSNAALLLAASALIVLALGLVHLLYTFSGDKFEPRDAALKAGMQTGVLRLTRETTVWKAWIGFNASHSYGAILFGLVWGYLALAQPAFLLGSTFLLALGGVLLVGYAHLAWRYWFSIPFRGMVLASALYGIALLMLF
ncbi:MAG: hypothetical protein AB7I35_13665 [Ramlibacter sp.]